MEPLTYPVFTATVLKVGWTTPWLGTQQTGCVQDVNNVLGIANHLNAIAIPFDSHISNGKNRSGTFQSVSTDQVRKHGAH
jgi:hypothetical protein